jgi:hypothetical protein
LWIKQNSVDIFGTKKIENLPEIEFYVVYNGTAELKETHSTFKHESEGLKIDVKVKIIDIRFSKLENTAPENSLAGYSYFYNEYDNGIKSGMTKEKSFETARTKCMEKGYMAGFIEQEGFVMFYKDFLNYDEQLKSEGRAEGEAIGEARGEARGIFESALKFLQGGTSLEDVVRVLGLSETQAKELASRV